MSWFVLAILVPLAALGLACAFVVGLLAVAALMTDPSGFARVQEKAAAELADAALRDAGSPDEPAAAAGPLAEASPRPSRKASPCALCLELRRLAGLGRPPRAISDVSRLASASKVDFDNESRN